MPKLSASKLAARRQHILKSAAVCFDREGFHRTTIADVRREAKVSTGAIYTYFPNKEALIRALLEDAQADRSAQLARASAAPNPRLSEARLLSEWVSNVFTKDGNHVARVNVNLWAEALRDRSVAKLAQTALREARQSVAKVVAWQLAQESAPKRDLEAKDVAAVLIGILLGLEVQEAIGVKLDAAGITRVLNELFPVDGLASQAKARPRNKRR